MSKVLVTDSHLTDIANAIREKNNTTKSYKPSEMPKAIREIESGGTQPTGTINITENGTYNVAEYEKASVQVTSTPVTKGFIVNQFDDNGRALDVTVVGLKTLPAYYFERHNEAEADALAKYLEKVSSADVTATSTQSFYLSPVETIDFPNLTSVGQASFKNCYNLKTIDISKVKSINKQGFYNCKVLLAEKLSENLTTLGEQAFYTCSKIKIKEIPSGITSILASTFYACSAITEMTLLGDVTSIGNSAFSNTKIAKFVLPNVTSVPTISNVNIFTNTPIRSGTGYIYVPDALVEAFKSAEYWSTYAEQIKGLSEL